MTSEVDRLYEWEYGSRDPDFRAVSDWLTDTLNTELWGIPYPIVPTLLVGKLVSAGRSLAGVYAKVQVASKVETSVLLARLDATPFPE